jgi:hypothetical protein
MAYVRNPSEGEISVLVGTQAVVYRDRELAARLSHAAGRGRLA